MSNPKRIAIVVWHWNEAENDPLPIGQYWDSWNTPDSNILFIRADLEPHTDRSQTYDRLVELAHQHFESSKDHVLYLLHTSQPHNFDESVRLELARRTHLPSDQFRVRLFGMSGGRRGPIYHGHNSVLGVLGTVGEFAVSYDLDLPDGTSLEVWSDLIVDSEKKLLNAKHLEHLWACYWETPFRTLWRLAEDFQQHCMGFEAQWSDPAQHLLEYLRQDPLLWHKLISFANREDLATDSHLLRAAADCRADNHCSHLNWLEENALSERLGRLRDHLADLLDQKPSALTKTDHEHIQHIHTELKEIVERLPPNLRQ